MNPKDLLDPEKMKKFNKELQKYSSHITEKQNAKILKRMDSQDNATRLNQMGQEGNKLFDWGVEPGEFDF